MSKKFRFKALFATALLAVALIFGAASTGNAELEIPAGMRLSGPAILGTVTLTNTHVLFEGKCKGVDVSIDIDYPVSEIIGADISAITVADLEGMYLQGAGNSIAGCSDGADITINTVLEFDNYGTTVVAKVILLYVY